MDQTISLSTPNFFSCLTFTGRFHMYQNVIYIIYRINDALLHCIGNLMGLRDRDLWIHFYIKGNHIEIPYHS